MILDGEPYPYEKWLHHFASMTPTGGGVAAGATAILDHLAADALRLKGPANDNPLCQALRAIRMVLVDAARSKGIDEPWLTRWWEHIEQARSTTANLVW